MAPGSWENPQELGREKGAVLRAVRQNGLALRDASADLRADKNVVLEAVKQNGAAMGYASRALRADKEVMLQAVRMAGYTLVYASHELQADKDVVLEAVRQEGEALKYASDDLQADKDVVLEAVHQSKYAVVSVSRTLGGDGDVVRAMARKGASIFPFASPVLLAQKDLLLLAARYLDGPDARNDLQVIVGRGVSASVIAAAIAIAGEQVPTVGVIVVREPSLVSGSLDVPPEDTFRAEISLMSGVSFVCSIAESSSAKTAGRPGLVVNDLAKKIVEELPIHTEMSGVERVFIHFTINDDGDAAPGTPWQWDRPLTDFLFAPSEGA